MARRLPPSGHAPRPPNVSIVAVAAALGVVLVAACSGAPVRESTSPSGRAGASATSGSLAAQLSGTTVPGGDPAGSMPSDGSTDGPSDAPSSSSPSTTSASGRTSTTGTGFTNSPATGYAVGTFWRDFVDTKRGRTLKTLVHYPARGGRGAVGATPADGEFPIVLMAHGYLLPAAGYERILTTLTAVGYITVSPAFPGTSAETGTGNRGDITNQPADLTFVLDQVVALASEPGSPLPRVAQPDRVGVIGHSDGGLTVSAIAYNARYRDPRVAAAVVMTGGRALFPGAYFNATNLPPVLAVHGTNDGNPYSASKNLVADAAAIGLPAYLLTVENGGHIEPFMHETAMPELAEVVQGFLDVHLRGDPTGTERMRRRGNVTGKLHLEP